MTPLMKITKKGPDHYTTVVPENRVDMAWELIDMRARRDGHTNLIESRSLHAGNGQWIVTATYQPASEQVPA